MGYPLWGQPPRCDRLVQFARGCRYVDGYVIMFGAVLLLDSNVFCVLFGLMATDIRLGGLLINE